MKALAVWLASEMHNASTVGCTIPAWFVTLIWSTEGASKITLNNSLRTFTRYTLNKFSRRCTQCRACIVEVEQLFCDLAGYVLRPAFPGVECNDAQRTLELAFNDPADNGRLGGLVVANLSPDATICRPPGISCFEADI